MCPRSLMQASLLHLTSVQTACPMAAASTRLIPSLTVTGFVHPSQRQTTHTPVLGNSPHSCPNLVLTLALCHAACQTPVPTPSKASSPSQILISNPCCCPAFTPPAQLIPVLNYNLRLTPSTDTLRCCHMRGSRWVLVLP